MRFFLVSLALLVTLAGLTPAVPQVGPLGFMVPAPGQAVIRELRPLPGDDSSVGLHVNNHGQVVGDSFSEDANEDLTALHPVTWVNGAPRMLPLPPGVESGEANSIDLLGRILGSFGALDGPSQGAWWVRNRLVPLPVLPNARQTFMSEQNGHLMAVGESHDVNERSRATLWIGNRVYDLGVLPGSEESEAIVINFHGHSVGSSYSLDADGNIINSRATLWKVRRISELPGLPGASDSLAISINDPGLVVGWSQPAGGQPLPVLWERGRPRALPLPADAVEGEAIDINNAGLVVGATVDANEVLRGALWQRGNYVDLEALLPPGSGWTELEPLIVNDRGQMTGVGLLNDAVRGFLLDLRPAG